MWWIFWWQYFLAIFSQQILSQNLSPNLHHILHNAIHDKQLDLSPSAHSGGDLVQLFSSMDPLERTKVNPQQQGHGMGGGRGGGFSTLKLSRDMSELCVPPMFALPSLQHRSATGLGLSDGRATQLSSETTHFFPDLPLKSLLLYFIPSLPSKKS